MDPISSYCKKHDIRPADFARMVGKSPQLICDFQAGRCGFSDETKLEILEATEGEITPLELIEWPVLMARKRRRLSA